MIFFKMSPGQSQIAQISHPICPDFSTFPNSGGEGDCPPVPYTYTYAWKQRKKITELMRPCKIFLTNCFIFQVTYACTALSHISESLYCVKSKWIRGIYDEMSYLKGFSSKFINNIEDECCFTESWKGIM